MNRAALNTIAASALALVAGVAAGSLRSISPDRKRASSSGKDAPETPQTNEPMARAMKTEMGAKRWLLLVSAAEKATARDMPGLIRAAGNDSAAVRMLAGHWAVLDPKDMFASLYAELLVPEDSPGALPQRWTLCDTLFEEWAKSDPAGVVEALTDIQNFSARETMRHSVVRELMKGDVETGIRAMSDWTITNYLPDMKNVAAWAARDPRHAAEVAAKYSRGYAAQEALKHIGKAWAASDPEGGLRFASTLPGPSRSALAPEILRGWAERDLASAARFTAAQTDTTFRNALAQGLVGAWGKKDPAGALAWSQENLSGTARNDAVGGIVQAVAEKNLVTAGELIAGMDAGPTQDRAAASLFEVWFKKGADQRDAALEWLAALPDKEARRAALERVQWDWVWSDPAGVRDFVTGPHRDLASSGMIQQVARQQAGKNPEAAMEWAGKLPAERVSEAREQILQTWLQVRPEGATNYARNLPAGDDRDRAVRTIATHLGWGSPEQAGAFLKTLPDAEQKAVMESFANMDPKHRSKIEAAMKQPPAK